MKGMNSCTKEENVLGYHILSRDRPILQDIISAIFLSAALETFIFYDPLFYLSHWMLAFCP